VIVVSSFLVENYSEIINTVAHPDWSNKSFFVSVTVCEQTPLSMDKSMEERTFCRAFVEDLYWREGTQVARQLRGCALPVVASRHVHDDCAMIWRRQSSRHALLNAHPRRNLCRSVPTACRHENLVTLSPQTRSSHESSFVSACPFPFLPSWAF